LCPLPLWRILLCFFPCLSIMKPPFRMSIHSLSCIFEREDTPGKPNSSGIELFFSPISALSAHCPNLQHFFISPLCLIVEMTPGLLEAPKGRAYNTTLQGWNFSFSCPARKLDEIFSLVNFGGPLFFSPYCFCCFSISPPKISLESTGQTAEGPPLTS